MTTLFRAAVILLLLSILVAVLLMFRGEREYRPAPQAPTTPTESHSLSAVHPGGSGAPELDAPPGYDESAFSISQGATLYRSVNCHGCHHNGGGGIGPALMDDTWLYGSSPRALRATIVEGRPNGMPAFRGKLTEQQVLQLVAYVRSLAALVPSTQRASRDDHLSRSGPRTQQDPRPPVSGGQVPATAERMP